MFNDKNKDLPNDGCVEATTLISFGLKRNNQNTKMFKCLFFQLDRKKIILDKSHRNLLTVPFEILNYEKSLVELNLSCNNIKDLPQFLFQLKRLRVLNLADNCIEDIPHTICLLGNLETLDLNQNEIHELPITIVQCLRLANLSLKGNPLQRISDDFFNFANLTNLNLNDTSLTTLNDNIKNLSCLVNLEIRENFLTAIPDTIGFLTKLQKLDLGSNEIENLTSSIGKLENLNELWIDCNKLTTLPLEIGQLKRLQILDASKNDISQIPEEIGLLSSLNDLNLSNNRLVSLPNSIGDIKELKMLKLDSNIIEKLPNSIGNLTQLKEMFLQENLLDEFPLSIGNLKEMVHLNADCNCIKQFPVELCKAVNLTILSLQSNKIKYIPDEISNLNKLHVLNLAKNLLQYLPYSMAKLMLTALWLVDNQHEPIVPLVSDILPNNKVVLKNYLLPQEIEDTLNQNDDLNSQIDEQSSVGGGNQKQSCLVKFDFSDASTIGDIDVDEKTGVGLKRQVTPFPRDLRLRHPNIAKNNTKNEYDNEAHNFHDCSSNSSSSDTGSEDLPFPKTIETTVYSNNTMSTENIYNHEVKAFFNEDNSSKYEKMNVTLSRIDDSFGFDISGGVGTPSYDQNFPNAIFVSSIRFKDVNKCLRIGDRIIEVNDINIEDLAHRDFVDLLKSFNIIVLAIIRDSSKNYDSMNNYSNIDLKPLIPNEVQQKDVKKDIDDESLPIEKITIIKGENILGFSIAGGIDEFYFPFNKRKPSIYITKVVENSAAQLSGIKPGFKIISVNSINIEHFTHNNALTEIAKHSDHLILEIKRTTPPDGLEHIIIERKHGVRIGFSIKGGIINDEKNYEPIIISKITNGVVKDDGRLKVGMCLMEVNGISLIGSLHDNAVKILKNIGYKLEFVVCNGIPDSENQ